jgi:hypothetical protein
MTTNSNAIRTFRVHLAIIGYLAICCSTLYWGVRTWDDCVLPDKIISVASLVFIVQNWFNDTPDLPQSLRWTLVASIIAFIYIHIIR